MSLFAQHPQKLKRHRSGEKTKYSQLQAKSVTARANLLTSSAVQLVKNVTSTQLDQCNHEFVDQMCHDGVAQFTLRKLLMGGMSVEW